MAYFIWGVALIFLLISFLKSREKTALALKKASKSFLSLLPSVLAILMFIAIITTLASLKFVPRILGGNTGISGVFLGTGLGTILFMPSFIAIPLAATLVDNGAGFGQTIAFMTSLIGVGIVSIPLESKFFTKRLVIYRTILAIGISIFLGVILYVVTL